MNALRLVKRKTREVRGKRGALGGGRTDEIFHHNLKVHARPEGQQRNKRNPIPHAFGESILDIRHDVSAERVLYHGGGLGAELQPIVIEQQGQIGNDFGSIPL
jgi:hypothetical protein